MNIVLYNSEDMEPITILDIPLRLLKRVPKYKLVFPVMKPTNIKFNDQPSAQMQELDIIEVWFERYIRNTFIHYFMFTNMGENALLLKSGILPGQQKEFQEVYRKGFVDGLIKAMES